MKPVTVIQPVRPRMCVVADAVPLGVAPQQRGADQDARGDDDAERLDRDPSRAPSWKNGTPVVAAVVAPDNVKATAYMRG